MNLTQLILMNKNKKSFFKDKDFISGILLHQFLNLSFSLT